MYGVFAAWGWLGRATAWQRLLSRVRVATGKEANQRPGNKKARYAGNAKGPQASVIGKYHACYGPQYPEQERPPELPGVGGKLAHQQQVNKPAEHRETKEREGEQQCPQANDKRVRNGIVIPEQIAPGVGISTSDVRGASQLYTNQKERTEHGKNLKKKCRRARAAISRCRARRRNKTNKRTL